MIFTLKSLFWKIILKTMYKKFSSVFFFFKAVIPHLETYVSTSVNLYQNFPSEYNTHLSLRLFENLLSFNLLSIVVSFCKFVKTVLFLLSFQW